MESVSNYTTMLENLCHQARKLTAAGFSLSNIFDEEAVRLNRRDEALRLKALHISIRRQLDQAKRAEDSASYGYNTASLIISLGKLAVGGTIKMVSENKQLLAFSDHLLNSLGGEERPFGMVLICVGPKGMPDDVKVVSISRLARESNRGESKVINELQGSGRLLLSEKAFALLIDKLANDVQEGRLVLPICMETLLNNTPFCCVRCNKTGNCYSIIASFVIFVHLACLSSPSHL